MIQRILFLAANPTDTGRLRLDKEVREIGEGLKRSNERNRFELIPKFAVKVEDLRRSLLDHSPQIVHFAGHGEGVNGILLEDDQGKAFQVPTDALAGLFELCTGHIECVVLNACYSDVQAEAIAMHIPYVIGMKTGVSDDAALEFAVGFYDAIGAGRSIEAAFRFGCNAIAMRNLSGQLIPELKKKALTATEQLRLESGYNPVSGLFMNIAVLNEDTSSWKCGDETIHHYSVNSNDQRIRIASNLGYLATFNAGGPIEPLNYMTPTYCGFRWDFPIFDVKILNNRRETLYLTEVVFDIEESRADPTPLLTIKHDTYRSYAGHLLLINEGGCDLTDLTISFHLLPGEVEAPAAFEPPYEHSIALPLLTDQADVDVTQAFQNEGVDIDGLIQLTKGRWESKDTFVAPTGNGSKERMAPDEVDVRLKQYLGKFQDQVGTLAGEISFITSENPGQKHCVTFSAHVYLSNKNRLGVPRPPTYAYDTRFDTRATHYQRRVQISHELQPGETDRLTVKVAVAQSSFHRFRASIVDITGIALQSPQIELICFVPRSCGEAVTRAISPRPESDDPDGYDPDLLP